MTDINAIFSSVGIDPSTLTQIDGGFRIKETEDYVIEVHKMLFNWRLVVMPPNQQMVIDHGYCYFGTGAEALTRALVAGMKWDDPYGQDPIGYDKQAY